MYYVSVVIAFMSLFISIGCFVFYILGITLINPLFLLTGIFLGILGATFFGTLSKNAAIKKMLSRSLVVFLVIIVLVIVIKTI